MQELEWRTEKRKISELTPYERNPRQVTDKQTKELKDSIERFNFVEIPAINTNNVLIAGHQRLKVMAILGRGDQVIDVRVPNRELTEKEVAEYCIRSNKNTGEWNYDELCNFGEDLLKEIGFDSKELDKIFQIDTQPGEDDVPEVKTTDIKLGDIFKLGEHRLMCGDSTKHEDVDRLMAGEKADMVFTDPPYGVSYDGGHATDKRREKLQGDESVALYEPASLIAMQFSTEISAYYLFHAGVKGFQAAAAAAAAGWEIRSELIWNKNMAQFGAIGAQYKQKHEPFYYCFKKGKSPQWFGNNNETTVWDCDRSSKNEFHPTQKPVALAERAITNSSARDNIVLDLFGGSGSTLIACEKLNRKCRMMEIDPKYCQAIINRWEKFTNKKAVKIDMALVS